MKEQQELIYAMGEPTSTIVAISSLSCCRGPFSHVSQPNSPQPVIPHQVPLLIPKVKQPNSWRS